MKKIILIIILLFAFGVKAQELKTNSQKNFTEIINVRDYGVVGDGVTDNTTAIQSVLTNYAGKTIWFPKDYIFVSGNLTVPDSTTITGGGTLKYNGLNNFLSLGNECKITNLAFEGGLTLAPTTNGSKVALRNEATNDNRVTVDNCTFNGFSGCGIRLVNTQTQEYRGWIINNCRFYHNWTGLELSNSGEYNIVTNCIFTNNYYGLTNWSGNNNISQCMVDSNTYGMLISDDGNGGHGSLSNSSFNHNRNWGIRIDSVMMGFAITNVNIFSDSLILFRNKGILISNSIIAGHVLLDSNNSARIENCSFRMGQANVTQVHSDSTILWNNRALLDNQQFTSNSVNYLPPNGHNTGSFGISGNIWQYGYFNTMQSVTTKADYFATTATGNIKTYALIAPQTDLLVTLGIYNFRWKNTYTASLTLGIDSIGASKSDTIYNGRSVMIVNCDASNNDTVFLANIGSTNGFLATVIKVDAQATYVVVVPKGGYTIGDYAASDYWTGKTSKTYILRSTNWYIKD